MPTQTECLKKAQVQIDHFIQQFTALKAQIQQCFVGQNELVEDLLCVLFAGGHALLEGVPGLGKTMLSKTLAQATAMDYERIQCTPDLMPSDITGHKTLVEAENGSHQLIFEEGPVISHFILVDEINRATPKTQSALLEAMQEGQVTIGRETIQLPHPNFFVATQNPVEHEGTYPLPEAQLDRFLAKLKVRYPETDDYRQIIELTTTGGVVAAEPVLTAETVLQMQQTVAAVETPELAIDYVVRLVRATQPQCSDMAIVREHVTLGASPRAVQSMVMLGKVKALLDGRSSVSVKDLKGSAAIALRHRIAMGFSAMADQIDADQIINEILNRL